MIFLVGLACSRDEQRRPAPQVEIDLLNYNEADANAAARAAATGDVATLRALLDKGVAVDTYGSIQASITRMRLPLLAIAAREGQVEVVRLLLARGAKPVDDDPEVRQMLHAVVGGKLEIVRLFVEAGANIHGGRTFSFQDPEISVYLIERGINVTAIDPSTGHTPLILAVLQDNRPGIDAILAKKANINARGKYGQHALETALEFVTERTEPLVEYLLERGASPSLETSNGLTPIAHVEKMNRTDEMKGRLIAMLRARGATK